MPISEPEKNADKKTNKNKIISRVERCGCTEILNHFARGDELYRRSVETPKRAQRETGLNDGMGNENTLNGILACRLGRFDPMVSCLDKQPASPKALRQYKHPLLGQNDPTYTC